MSKKTEVVTPEVTPEVVTPEVVETPVETAPVDTTDLSDAKKAFVALVEKYKLVHPDKYLLKKDALDAQLALIA